MGGTSEGLKAAAESGWKGKYREVPEDTHTAESESHTADAGRW